MRIDQLETHPIHEERISEIVPDATVAQGLRSGEWLVATAPRPIPGDVEWRGGGGAGYFYAALPVDPQRAKIPEIHDWTLQRWRDLRATQLEPWGEDEIWRRLLADMVAEGISLEEAFEYMPRPADWGGAAEHRGLPTPLRLPTKATAKG